jgi:hypothetical protein
MKAAVCIMVVCLFCSGGAAAEPVDLGLDATVDYYGLIDATTFFTSARARLTVVPELSFKTGSRVLEARLSALLYLQAFKEPVVVEPEGILREVYVGLHVGLFDIFVGQRFVRWGKVDVMSPLNNVNHSDITVLSMDDPYEGVLPDLMLQIQFYPSDLWYVELVYVPFLSPDIINIEETIIKDQLQIDLMGLTSVYNVDAAFLNRSVQPFTEYAHSMHVAAHVNSFWFDLTGVYSFFIDQSPDFDLLNVEESIIVDGSTTTHTISGTAYPAHNRAHSIGLSAAFYMGDFLISADTALKLTKDLDGTRMDVKNKELFSVLQIERLFWQNRLRAQANVFHRYILNYEAVTVSDYSPVVEAYIREIVAEYLIQKPRSQAYALLHGDASFLRERLSVAASVIYGFDEKVVLVMPRLSFKLTDYVSLRVGSDMWFGQEGKGLLGASLYEDNVYVRAQLEL